MAAPRTLNLNRTDVANIRKASEGQQGNARWSKMFIKKVLKLDIGDRGGLFIFKTPRGHSLYATKKTPLAKYNRKAGKTDVFGEPGGTAIPKVIIDLETGEEKCLKVLYQDIQAVPEYLELFMREAKILEKVGQGLGDLIWKMRAEDEIAGTPRPCIVMDVAPGDELYDLLKEGVLSPLHRIEIFLKLLLKVEWLHELGVIHCDLKPENIKCALQPENIRSDLVTNPVTVIDYGFAQEINTLKQTGGTLEYRWYKADGKAVPEIDVYSMSRVARQLFGFDLIFPNNKSFCVDRKAKAAFNKKDREVLYQLILEMEGNPHLGLKSPISIKKAIKDMRAFTQEWLRTNPQKAETTNRILALCTPQVEVKPSMPPAAVRATVKEIKERKEIKEHKADDKLAFLLITFLTQYKSDKKLKAYFEKRFVDMKEIMQIRGKEIEAIRLKLPESMRTTENAILAYIPSVLPTEIPSVLAELRSLLVDLGNPKITRGVMDRCVDLFELLTKLDANSKEKNIALTILSEDAKKIPDTKKLKEIFATPKSIIRMITIQLEILESKQKVAIIDARYAAEQKEPSKKSL